MGHSYNDGQLWHRCAVYSMWGGEGGPAGGGRREGTETIFWVQLPGNNEITRFNSWVSLPVKTEKKQKSVRA